MAVTIKDVAKLANTSTATVSKVMNGSYSISEQTAQRVREAMEQLHYLPNQRARNFANQSTQMIIFVTSLGENMGFSNPHMFEIMCGLENTLTNKGYSLMVKSVSQKKVCEFIRDTFERQQTDGFVIHASVLSKELDELIYELGIPHLVIGNPNFPVIFAGLILIIVLRVNLRQNIFWKKDISHLLLLEEQRKIRFPCIVWRGCCLS